MTSALGGAEAGKSASKMDDDAISSSLGPGFARVKREAEHESRIVELLVAHQQQLLEAMRAELARAALPPSSTSGRTLAETLVETSETPPSVMAASHETGGAFGGMPRRQQNHKRSLTHGSPKVHYESSMHTVPPHASSSVGMRAMQDDTQEYKEDVEVHRAAILEYSFNTSIGKLIQLPIFECIVCVIVVMNALSIGWYADWNIKNLYELHEEPKIFRVLDVAFSAVFVVELILRIIGEGWSFFSHTHINRNRPWNILDTILVVSVMLGELVAQFMISVTMVRVLRMLRAVRVIRIIRITRFFTDLRLLVMGLICAARSLFWVMILLVSVIYMFSVCIMQLTADSLATSGERLKADRMTDEILEHVGSLDNTMYTLYKSVTGGTEWGALADLLAEKSVFVAAVYSMYIAFALLCVLNIVTGVFVQNASTIAHDDQMELVLEHLERRREWMKEVIDLFKTADTSGDGQIDWRSFSACLHKPSVQACFSQLGINLDSISSCGLFCLFDTNDDGTIDLEEFAHGILKLHGTARSFDLHLVGKDNKRILQHVKQITKRFP